MNDTEQKELAKATQEFEDWVRRYLSCLGRLASYFRGKIDSGQTGGLPVSASLEDGVKQRLLQFDAEITELYTDYVVLRRKYSHLIPARLVQARDTALGRLRGKTSLAVTNIRLAAEEFTKQKGYSDLPNGVKAQVDLLAQWTLDQQMDEFKEIFDEID